MADGIDLSVFDQRGFQIGAWGGLGAAIFFNDYQIEGAEMMSDQKN
jgi:hypothetical protein